MSEIWTLIFARNTEGVKRWLKEGHNVNALSCGGATPLNWACYTRNEDIALLFLEHGATVTVRYP